MRHEHQSLNDSFGFSMKSLNSMILVISGFLDACQSHIRNFNSDHIGQWNEKVSMVRYKK